MPENTALDAMVQAALLEGENQEEWEFIIKYYGDIQAVADAIGATVDILTESYAIISVPLERLNEMYRYPEIEYIEMPKRLGASLQAAIPESCISSVTTRYGYRGAGVILGIIDSGIDYTHPDFINEDGTTRIHAIWDQTIEGSPPPGFNYGSLYTREMINEALQATDIVSQMKIVPSMDTLGHGTHVNGP